MADIGKIVGGVLGGANPAEAPATILSAAKGILGFFKMDKTVQAQLEQQLTVENIDLQKTEMANALSAALAQADIDKQEAASTNWFVAGWRPAVGWVCVLGLLYGIILQPFAQFLLAAFHWHQLQGSIPLPALDLSQILTLLVPMLGLGALRTAEKITDAAGNH